MPVCVTASSNKYMIRVSKLDVNRITNVSITATSEEGVGLVLTHLDHQAKIAISMTQDEAQAFMADWMARRCSEVSKGLAEWSTLKMSKAELAKRLGEAQDNPLSLGEALCDLRSMKGGRWTCRALGARWGVAHTTAAGWVRKMAREGLLFDVSATVKTVN